MLNQSVNTDMPDFTRKAGFILEIGERGGLTQENATDIARLFLKLAGDAHPDSFFGFSIGGYDDDDRNLYQIPEVRDYVKWFSREARIDRLRIVGCRFHEQAPPVISTAKGSGYFVPVEQPATVRVETPYRRQFEFEKNTLVLLGLSGVDIKGFHGLPAKARLSQ